MRVNAWIMCSILCLALVSTANAQGGRGGRGFGGGGGMFGRSNIFMIVNNDAVQKDVGLSDDDAAKIKKVTDEFGEALRAGSPDMSGFRDMSREEREKAMAKGAENFKATSAKFLPKLKEAMSADQFTRLQQINWQNMGTQAYGEDEVIKAVSITKEQQDKMKTVNADLDKKRDEMFQGGGAGAGGREAFQKLREERTTQINAILSKEQLDKYATLVGKKFDTEQLQFGGRGGRGGGGGGGDGGGRGKRPQPKSDS